VASIGVSLNEEYQNMQLHAELVVQPSQTEAAAVLPRKRKSVAARKVTVRLTEEVCEQLRAATERPGVGKSMVVEAALERFLSPRAPVEDLGGQRFDDMHARFDRLEHDIRMIAETVALHARYHLTVMPTLPQSRQHDACLLGDERFRVLAEQVDRRVRQCRPLMQETIDRLNSADCGGPEPATGEDAPHGFEPGHIDQKPASDDVDVEHASSAAAGEGGSNLYFH
jgi:hypothetical protein